MALGTTLLETVKQALRVSHDKLDDGEIVPLINAAKKELLLAGVVVQDETDPLIIRAVTSYCKAQFGYDNPESDKFMMTFEGIRALLSMTEEYNTPGGVKSNG